MGTPLTTEEEDRITALHEEVLDYNWDDGAERMLEIARDPTCDLGTAMQIYWNAQPVFYKQFASRGDVESYNLASFDLVAEIEKKVAAGFYKSGLVFYDPREDQVIDDDDPDTGKIPPVMLQKVEGKYYRGDQ